MPLCDEVALHDTFLRQYQYYTLGTKPRPEPKPTAQHNLPAQQSPPHDKFNQNRQPAATQQKQPRHRFQVRPDNTTGTKSWVELCEMDDKEQLQQKQEPMVTSPPPKPAQTPAKPQTASALTAVNIDGQPMVQMSMAQFQALVNTPSPQQLQPQTPAQQQWDFSQSQSPLENTFFDQEAPLLAQQAAMVKKAAPTPMAQLPLPRYHPTIHTRPTWEDTLTPREHDKIFDTQMIWSCQNHYNIPAWAKTPHSAASLYDIVHRSIMTEETKARYREMPNYRQFPGDGLNSINDIAIFFQSTTSEENIHFKVSSQPYKQLQKKTQLTGAPEVSEIHFPAFTLSRFMVFFLDVTKERLKPAMTDVQENTFVLFCKQARIANYTLTLEIMTTEGHNGIERTLQITHMINREGHKPTSVRIPWIRMAQTLTTLRQVHEELVHTGFI
jgi:hypothetical protein